MASLDVSVVIPTFRREQLVQEAIASALSQQGVSLEVIVVDDSGTGSARDAVAAMNDPRIRYVARSQPGGSPAIPRNEGAKLASGRYVHFLDDDDLLEEGALAALAGAMDRDPKAGMAFGVITPFGDDAAMLRRHAAYYREAARIARGVGSKRALVASLVFLPTLLVNSACMARRDIFLATGGYDSAISIAEDVELWGRVARLAEGYAFVDRPVMRYRTGGPSITNGTAIAEKMLVSYRRMHDKYRASHGTVEFLLMKVWARTLLRRRAVPSET